ncbi:MAG: N-6 DNA methylase [Mycoplasmatales bacterium]
MKEINRNSENEFEKQLKDKLGKMADGLRGSVPPSKYKEIILGVVFLKYISDSFIERYNELAQDGYNLEEDRDEYTAENIFFVPMTARWNNIKENAKQPNIGQIIDDAFREIEKENKSLKNVLPKIYGSADIDKTKLGELIDGFSIDFSTDGYKAKDILGRVYEYFLHRFGTTENGEFYTPNSIVELIVEMLEPYNGRIYDPACGSGGMFVQSAKFINEHKGKLKDISVFGQEYTAETWRLCKMNLAIHGIDGDLGDRAEDTFKEDLHRNYKMDYVMANPPFNMKDYYLNPADSRYKQFGVPPSGNANYAWLSHMISKLSQTGSAGIVLANGSLSTSGNEEYQIRKNFLDNNIVDAIVAMPDKLFFKTGISVCIWFFSKKRDNRKNQVLFIDARNKGSLVTRSLRELSKSEIKEIATVYHNFKEQNDEYKNQLGFCNAVSLDEISASDYALTPGRYVGLEEQEEDDEDFDLKMDRLTSELGELFNESSELEQEIKKQLESIGYEVWWLERN